MIFFKQLKVALSELEREAEKKIKRTAGEETEEAVLREIEHAFVLRSAWKELYGKKTVEEGEVLSFQIRKKSVDARKKYNGEIYFIYQVLLSLKNEKRLRKLPKNAEFVKQEKDENRKTQRQEERTPQPVVVGSGPAGLFCALTLARAGRNPILIEQGGCVEERMKKVHGFWNGDELDPETNVQFGEGGAGTFSDGKLNTMVKDKNGYSMRVFRTFVEHGAPEEILYLNKPHIGTDYLCRVVSGIREEIRKLGGEVRFHTKLTDLFYDKTGKLSQIEITGKENGESRKTVLDCDELVLALGHSARQTFSMLEKRGVFMEPKPFAIGVRVEHPQKMIDKLQYGRSSGDSLFLKPADYKLTETINGRGTYSFCMCPGGYVVNASSEPGYLTVNGMSYHNRGSENANAAIVVAVNPDDYGGEGPLRGVEFQRKWEKKAYEAGMGSVPLQLFGDFKEKRVSTGFGRISVQHKGGYRFANLWECLPEFVSENIREGLTRFGQRMKGYDGEDVILSGIEARTSSPVRIRRDECLQANIRGIYPCGEGAGYAGGITSAAMDGIRVAEAILNVPPSYNKEYFMDM